MKKCWIVRHGHARMQPEQNPKDPNAKALTDIGALQAVLFRDWINDHHTEPALIVSSPYQRAVSTASILSRPEQPVYAMEELKEMDLGDLTGSEDLILDLESWDQEAPQHQAETISEVIERAQQVLFTLQQRDQEGLALICAHSTWMALLYLHLNKEDGLPESIVPDHLNGFEVDLESMQITGLIQPEFETLMAAHAAKSRALGGLQSSETESGSEK